MEKKEGRRSREPFEFFFHDWLEKYGRSWGGSRGGVGGERKGNTGGVPLQERWLEVVGHNNFQEPVILVSLLNMATAGREGGTLERGKLGGGAKGWGRAAGSPDSNPQVELVGG